MLGHLLAVGKDHLHVDREDRLAVAADHDGGPEAVVFRRAVEVLHGVIEHVGASVHLVEEPAQVLPAHVGDDVEEVARFRMLERPSLEVRGHGALQRGPSDPALQGVQPQRRLAVGDGVARNARGEVRIARRRLRVGLRLRPVQPQPVEVRLALERDIPEDVREEPAEIPQRQVMRIVDRRLAARGRERVEPFVHPAVLELVAADHPVPPLVPGLVNGHAFRSQAAAHDEPPCARREERRVLHPVGVALVGGIDNGDVAVGIGAEPLAVVLQRISRGVEVPPGLGGVLRLKEEAHLHRRQRRMLEAGGSLQIVGARRPREVVHVLLVIPMRRRVVGVVAPIALDARGTDRPGLGNRQVDVIDAVIGKELGPGVELVTVPALVLQDAELRKPLSDEKEIPDRAGPRVRARDVRVPLHLDCEGAVRGHRLWQRDRHHRLIVPVAVVWRKKSFRRGDVDSGSAHDRNRRDIDAAAIFLAAVPVYRSAEGGLAHPGRAIVAPRVPVQMKLQVVDRLRGDVAPRDDFGSRDGPRRRIQACVDRVTGVARRPWRVQDAGGGRLGGRNRGEEQRARYEQLKARHLGQMLHRDIF